MSLIYSHYTPRVDDDGNPLPGIFGEGRLIPEREPAKRGFREHQRTREWKPDAILQLVPDGEGTMRIEGLARPQRFLPITRHRLTMIAAYEVTRQAIGGKLKTHYRVRVRCACGFERGYPVSMWRKGTLEMCNACRLSRAEATGLNAPVPNQARQARATNWARSMTPKGVA